MLQLSILSFFFFNDTATTEIYTLSLHDALPISERDAAAGGSHSHRDDPRLGARGRERVPRGLVPAHDRDPKPDREPGRERQAAGFGGRLPAAVPRAAERRYRAAGQSRRRPAVRSEEHTSELQSLAYLVCR